MFTDFLIYLAEFLSKMILRINFIMLLITLMVRWSAHSMSMIMNNHRVSRKIITGFRTIYYHVIIHVIYKMVDVHDEDYAWDHTGEHLEDSPLLSERLVRSSHFPA